MAEFFLDGFVGAIVAMKVSCLPAHCALAQLKAADVFAARNMENPIIFSKAEVKKVRNTKLGAMRKVVVTILKTKNIRFMAVAE